MVKFSIISPVYNTEIYLEDCIQSVIDQSFTDWEIIFINDGSTDNSLKVLKKYKNIDNRIKIIDKKNEGQGTARNIGLKQAVGDYVLYLDSDDWLEQDALSKLYKKFQEDNYDIIFFNVYNYYEKTGRKNIYLFNDCFYRKFKNETFNAYKAKDILFQTNGLAFKAYNRKFLVENKIQYSATKYIEDSEFFIKAILYAQKMVCLNELIVNYRIRKTSSRSTTHLNIDVIEQTFYTCESIFKEYYKKKPYKELLNSFIKNRVQQLFFHFARVEKSYRKKYFKMLKRLLTYINKNYSKDFIDLNSLDMMFDLVVQNNYLEFIIKRHIFLAKIHLRYYFEI